MNGRLLFADPLVNYKIHRWPIFTNKKFPNNLYILNHYRFCAFALSGPQPQKGRTFPQCTTCPDPSGKPIMVEYKIKK